MMAKMISITPVSHDPSEIILIYANSQETFLIIITVWKQLCCFIFFWKD